MDCTLPSPIELRKSIRKTLLAKYFKIYLAIIDCPGIELLALVERKIVSPFQYSIGLFSIDTSRSLEEDLFMGR